jgi:type IV secretion system protein VirD4
MAKKSDSAFGFGDSAHWADAYELHRSRYDPKLRGSVFLGQSLREDTLFCFDIGHADDAHLFTVAGAGSGKGRDLIIPNLMEWRGSAVVLDPKGENASVTARRRKAMGQNVIVLDPFKVVSGEAASYRASWNPLYEIDPSPANPEARHEVTRIAEACIPPEEGRAGDNARFFVTGARQMLSGLIAHILTREPLSRQHLPRLHELLLADADDDDENSYGRVWEEMAGNEAMGGLAKQAARYVRLGKGEEKSGLVKELGQHTEWMASPVMAPQLERSSFDMSILKEQATTLYLVLPFGQMDELKPWMRLVVSWAIRRLEKLAGVQSGTGQPILFFLDEFPSLGRFEVIEKTAAQMRGFGVKLWVFVQDVNQLEALYPSSWRTLIGNAGAACAFGISDTTTTLEISKMLGDHEVRGSRDTVEIQEHWFWGDVEGKRSRAEARERVPLLSPVEVGQYTGPDDNRMIVIRRGRRPLRLKRVPYFERYRGGPGGEYDDNPLHPR